MRKFSAIAALAFLSVIFPFIAVAQEQSEWDIRSLSQIVPGAPVGGVDFDMNSHRAFGTNGVFVKNGSTVLTADNVQVNQATGEAVADGNVHIEQGDEIWTGEHIRYNFQTHQMQSDQFRMGKAPVYMSGRELTGDITNQTYNARHAFVTTDDVKDPITRVRATRIKIVPDKYVEMWNAVLFVGDVPAFYFPYYRRNLGPHANNLNFIAGYRTSYGAYLLNTYTWWLNNTVNGQLHLDYRTERGVGLGPDIDLHLGQWGNATFSYYYTHDLNPNDGTNGLPSFGPVAQDRQRVNFGWQATPYTNLNVKALVNYQSDAYLEHDFFESDYRNNPQPNTFFEVNKYSDNWSLDALSTPQLNNFFDQVERLPDVRLTGFRQQLFDTPVYYDSESSVGYYKMFFAATNGAPALPTYSAGRADTFHQLTLPWTFFNWLNVTPNVGGRMTYYTSESGPGGTNDEASRAVFNTGVRTSFKLSQLWPDAKNSLFQVDGLRHIVEPSADYVFVPNPSKSPSQLPQFDSALPSLLLLPVQFPDYNNIDSIDSENVVRLGLRNTLQTKRDGEIDNLVDWNLMLDWRLNPNGNHNNLDEPFSTKETFGDLYSDFAFKPRSWIKVESQVREDINHGNLNMTFEQLTLTPDERWSFGLSYWYLRNGFDGFNQPNNFINTTVFYKMDDNYGFRATENFNVDDGRLQEQLYSVYRDMRSWTGALTFRVLNNTTGPTDFTVAVTFSLKASPSEHLGDDTVNPYHLVGQ
jgi:LPS-assembly protein